MSSSDSRSRRSGISNAVLCAACCVCALIVLFVVVVVLLTINLLNGPNGVNSTPAPTPSPPVAVPTPAPIESKCAEYNTFWVENLNDTGVGSLRQAILDANARVGADCIRFTCPNHPPNIIFLQTPLPIINDTIDIDGSCNDGVVCIEGTMLNQSCADQGVGTSTPFCNAQLGTTLLELGDRTQTTFNLASHSVVRNLRLSNDGLNKNNIQPEASKPGACNGIAVHYTSYVDIEDCEFSGFTTNLASLFVTESFIVNARRNVFDRSLFGVTYCSVVWGDLIGNTARNGFQTFGELPETVNGVSNAAFYAEGSSLLTFIDNDVGGFDFAFSFDRSNDLCVANNSASDLVFSTVLLSVSNRVLTIGNQFHTSTRHLLVDSTSRDNPILTNSLVRGALNAIDLLPVGADITDFDGITANDPGDPDTGGNNLQNHPFLLTHSVDVVSGLVDATGTLNSLPAMNFIIQCFVGTDSNRNGDRLLRTVVVNTDQNGDAAFDCSCGPADNVADCRYDTTSLPDDQALYLSATATLQNAEPTQCEAAPVLVMKTVAQMQHQRETLTTDQAKMSSDIAKQMVSLSTLAGYINEVPDLAPRPVCNGGAVVCLESGQKAFCSPLGIGEPECAYDESPRCVSDTSEFSYAYRADPAPVKEQGAPLHTSDAARIVVGVALVVVLL